MCKYVYCLLYIKYILHIVILSISNKSVHINNLQQYNHKSDLKAISWKYLILY